MDLLEKEKAEKLRMQWKKLWQEQAKDKLRAEGIATADYRDISIEKGTIIHATHNSKALDFKEILHQHNLLNSDQFIAPSPQIGGWNKFIKTNIAKQKSLNQKQTLLSNNEKKGKRQQKKGGRGWLHTNDDR